MPSRNDPPGAASQSAASQSAPTPAPSPAITLPPAAPATIRLSDDVPSADDPDLEGSALVGAAVVERLLGGRVIEEREQ
jgi:DNA polymerase-3 subunit gamma/tau